MNTSSSTPGIELTKQLDTLFTRQLAHVDAFIDYLDQIKQAIATNDTDTLNRLVTSAPGDFELIEALQQQQNKLLIDNGYSANDAGLNQCLKDCKQPHLITQHSELTEKLAKLQNALLVNELIVEKNQQRVRQSIRILTGHGGEKNTTTYSQQGDTIDSKAQGRSLAKA